MDYNAVLRNKNSSFAEKERAFSFFFLQYRPEGVQFIYNKFKKYIPQLPEKAAEAEDFYQEAAALLFDKIKRGVLCHENHTCEAWFNQLAIGLIANRARAARALPQNRKEAEAEAASENPEDEPLRMVREARFVDFDSLKLKVFGSENKTEQTLENNDLRAQLDALITEVSDTCKQYFNLFFANGGTESLFDNWKQMNPKTTRNSFDATTATCRKKLRQLIEKHNIKTLNQ